MKLFETASIKGLKSRSACSSFSRNSRLILFLFSLFLLLNPHGTSFAQLLTVSSSFDTTSIQIGEQTNFRISVEQPDDIYISFPDISDTLAEGIEILNEFPADTTLLENGRLLITEAFRITSFTPGNHEAGPFSFIFSADGEERVVNSRINTLEVTSPEVNAEEGIHDIKSPYEIPVTLLEVIPWLLFFIVLALLGWLLFKRFSNRRSPTPLKPDTPSEPPHTIALRELKKLKSFPLDEQGRIKEFYTRMTGILRQYIENMFVVKALEKTSEEVIFDLNRKDQLDSDVIKLLKDLFSVSDQVKFAKAIPLKEDHIRCLNDAFRFVKETYSLNDIEVQPEVDVKSGTGKSGTEISDSKKSGTEKSDSKKSGTEISDSKKSGTEKSDNNNANK